MRKREEATAALHIKLSAELLKRFEAYADDLGQTKTMALTRILKKALDEYEEKGEKG